MTESDTGLLVELVKKERLDWTGRSDEIHTHVERVAPLNEKIVIEFADDTPDITYPRDGWEICKVASEYPGLDSPSTRHS